MPYYRECATPDWRTEFIVARKYQCWYISVRCEIYILVQSQENVTATLKILYLFILRSLLWITVFVQKLVNCFIAGVCKWYSVYNFLWNHQLNTTTSTTTTTTTTAAATISTLISNNNNNNQQITNHRADSIYSTQICRTKWSRVRLQNALSQPHPIYLRAGACIQCVVQCMQFLIAEFYVLGMFL